MFSSVRWGTYESDCKCFRTTDKIMVFDIHHALELNEDAQNDSAGKVLGEKGIFGLVATAALAWVMV